MEKSRYYIESKFKVSWALFCNLDDIKVISSSVSYSSLITQSFRLSSVAKVKVLFGDKYA